MLITYDGKAPQVDPSAVIQSSAQLIGDIRIGRQSSIWFNVVIRADVHFVRIGERTNIQDNSTIHVTTGRWPTIIGSDVTVGHSVVLHGCTVGNRCLVGIGALVLDGCEIGDDCLVGAGALLTPGTTVAPGHLVLGSPAKIVRPLSAEELAELRRSALAYVEHAQHYRSLGIA